MDPSELEKIAKQRKTFLFFNYFWLVSIGGFIFPISFFEYFFFNSLMLVCYFFVGYIFAALYKNRPFLVFLTTFILNALSLSWRVLLEWGEYSMTRDFTPLNTSIHLISIPLYITIVYLLLQQLRGKV